MAWLPLLLGAVLACGSRGGGGRGGGDRDGGPMPMVDAGPGGADSGPMPRVDAGPPPAGGCATSTLGSPCGPQGVLRVAARLGAGMPSMSGTLDIRLSHYRLGEGASGGIPHTGTTSAASMSASADTQVAFDLCTGGEMWSEDNCEYNLWGFLDLNSNTVVDPGEPAGRTLADVSCRAPGSPCFMLVLDCIDGPSCVGFVDPGGCTCATPTCTSVTGGSIVTCSP